MHQASFMPHIVSYYNILFCCAEAFINLLSSFLDKINLNMLNNFDFFGTTPFWLVRGNRKAGSIQGVCLTLCLLTFFTWAFIIFSENFRNRTNPQVTTYTVEGADYNNYVVIGNNSINYRFGISPLNTRNFEYYNSSVINVEVMVINNDGSTEYYPMVVCDSSLINETIFSTGSMYCFDPNYEIGIAGINANILVIFSSCDNSTSNNTCADQNYINNIVANSEVVIVHTIYEINPLQYKDPLNKVHDYIAITTSIGIHKYVYAEYAQIEMSTDDGILFSSLSTIIQPTHYEYVNDFFLANNSEFMTVWIYSSGVVSIFSRVFEKIQDVLAKLMGSLNAVLAILVLFQRPFSRIKLYEHIANVLFAPEIKEAFGQKKKYINEKNLTEDLSLNDTSRGTLDGGEEKFAQPLNPSVASLRMISRHTKIPKRPTQLTPAVTRSKTNSGTRVWNIEKINAFKATYKKAKPQKNKLNIGVCEWLSSKFQLKDNPKLQFIKKIKSEIDQKIDVAEVCKSIYQLDLLKTLIMTQSQRVIFENLKNIRADPNERISIDARLSSDELQRVLLQAKSELENTEPKSELDRNLLTWYERQLETC